jgi:hypothetical protein
MSTTDARVVKEVFMATGFGEASRSEKRPDL